MLNELTQKEVMAFLEDRGYKVVELEWYTEKQFSVEHDWVCLITGNWEHIFWFILGIYYTLAD